LSQAVVDRSDNCIARAERTMLRASEVCCVSDLWIIAII
jgi:hypothetical protein